MEEKLVANMNMVDVPEFIGYCSIRHKLTNKHQLGNSKVLQKL